ncbi:MAG: hypothetical protein ACFCUE_07140 [Candidatus Bathyarchaeia archaeon]|jgi:hypothetical protein
MRLQFIRFIYGLTLAGLLFTPFIFYHSIAEPYIMGTLWGFQLPIGYVALLLSILAVTYPRLGFFKNLRLSTIVAISGLSLLAAFALSPNDYLINLSNGTNLTSSQIDVDASIGSLAIVWISILSIIVGLVWSAIFGFTKKRQSSPFHGWLPESGNSKRQAAGYLNLPNKAVFLFSVIALCLLVTGAVVIAPILLSNGESEGDGWVASKVVERVSFPGGDSC